MPKVSIDTSAYQSDKSGKLNRMPAEFQFIGSNDAVCNANSTWSVLCERDYPEKVASLDEWRGCEIQDQSLALTKFRCLGIKVLSAQEADDITALAEIRVWANGFCP